MANVYLCGHTGSKNRGCEAIVRSTVKILKSAGIEKVYAYTYDIEYDRRVGLDKVVELIPYPKKPAALRLLSYAKRKLLGDAVWGQRYLYKDLFKRAKSDDLIFAIGGDTYCCSEPNSYYALNEMAEEHGIKTVFWGCSVDERILKDTKMIEDVNRYSYIVTRETMTRDILEKCVREQKKIHLACDPAFQLGTYETELPKSFVENNTVGINISPLVLGDKTHKELMYENVHNLIKFIIEKTDMSVCLVPHVFDFDNCTQDINVLDEIYSAYECEPRVTYIRKDISCEAIKYVISKCRFYIGARTHSMIAAYSTRVPALALSYSIKSLGIAKDLLGQAEAYAICRKDVKNSTTLENAFVSCLVSKENSIREKYEKILTDYTESIVNIVKEELH